MNMNAAEQFNAAYAAARKIEFKADWNNGTGYYDGAVEDYGLDIKPGEMVATISHAPNNRKIIMIGTRFGNVVIFERYTDGANGVYVGNYPDEVRRLTQDYLSSRHTDHSMYMLLGNLDYLKHPSMVQNIGQRIEGIFEAWGEVTA